MDLIPSKLILIDVYLQLVLVGLFKLTHIKFLAPLPGIWMVELENQNQQTEEKRDAGVAQAVANAMLLSWTILVVELKMTNLSVMTSRTLYLVVFEILQNVYNHLISSENLANQQHAQCLTIPLPRNTWIPAVCILKSSAIRSTSSTPNHWWFWLFICFPFRQDYNSSTSSSKEWFRKVKQNQFHGFSTSILLTISIYLRRFVAQLLLMEFLLTTSNENCSLFL